MSTIVLRGQPEIAIGIESQIEPWLPLKQHTGNGGENQARRCSHWLNRQRVSACQGTRYSQYRGAGCQKKNLAARLGENFSLDSPFHRTGARKPRDDSPASGGFSALPKPAIS